MRIEALSKTYRYNWNVDVQEVDGVAEIVTVQSLDNFGDDRELRSDLVQKYGTPSDSGRDENYLSDWAAWELDGLSIYWQGRAADIPYGVAVIRTPKGAAFAKAQREADAATTPKL